MLNHYLMKVMTVLPGVEISQLCIVAKLCCMHYVTCRAYIATTQNRVTVLICDVH